MRPERTLTEGSLLQEWATEDAMLSGWCLLPQGPWDRGFGRDIQELRTPRGHHRIFYNSAGYWHNQRWWGVGVRSHPVILMEDHRPRCGSLQEDPVSLLSDQEPQSNSSSAHTAVLVQYPLLFSGVRPMLLQHCPEIKFTFYLSPKQWGHLHNLYPMHSDVTTAEDRAPGELLSQM